MDDIRTRYLRDQVLTASPAQRIVLLYDRALLDVRRALATEDASRGTHLGHAVEVLAELYGSLDTRAGGPAENLASLYAYLIGRLMNARVDPSPELLTDVEAILGALRDAWSEVADQLTGSREPLAAAARVG